NGVQSSCLTWLRLRLPLPAPRSAPPALRSAEKPSERVAQVSEPLPRRPAGLFRGMTGLLAPLLEGLAGFFAKVPEFLADLFSPLFKGLAGVLADFFESTDDLFPGFLNGIFGPTGCSKGQNN